jgi:hypothetical protein
MSAIVGEPLTESNQDFRGIDLGIDTGMPSSNATSFDGIGSGLLPPSENESRLDKDKEKDNKKKKEKRSNTKKTLIDKEKVEIGEKEMVIEDFDPI